MFPKVKFVPDILREVFLPPVFLAPHSCFYK